MVLAGVDFWYDNYGLWPWQTKPRPKTACIWFTASICANIRAFVKDLIETNVNISNELIFSVVYRSVNYIWLLAKLNPLCTRPSVVYTWLLYFDKSQKNEIYLFFFQIDGDTTFNIDRVVLERMTRHFQYKTLVVKANVTEAVTGITQEGSANIQYHSNPYKVEFHPNMADNFKPGFNPYPVLVSHTYITTVRGYILVRAWACECSALF